MENQGKRPDQIESSEKIVFYSIVSMIVIIIIDLLIQ
jgi:hypothetical protein